MEISPDATGVWVVTTKSSQYILDYDLHRLYRSPLPEREDSYPVADLRQDKQWIDFIKIGPCIEGAPMRIYCIGLAEDPDVVTYRLTTPVVAIEQIKGAS